MDKTTFVFGAPPESEEGKFVKFFSRLSLSLLLSMLLLVLVIISYIVFVFLNTQTQSSIDAYKSGAATAGEEINKNEKAKKAIEFLEDIDNRAKLADLIIETHTNAYALLEFFQTYTLPNVYLKSAKFISERVKVAPAAKKEFDIFKEKLTSLNKVIESDSLSMSLNTLNNRLRETSGFPKKSLIDVVKGTLIELQDEKNYPFETNEARSLAKELSDLAIDLSKKLSVGESVVVDGEAADFNTVAKQIVTFEKAIKKPFMDKDDNTIQNISAGVLSLTPEGKVAFKMNLLISPNYLLAK